MPVDKLKLANLEGPLVSCSLWIMDVDTWNAYDMNLEK